MIILSFQIDANRDSGTGSSLRHRQRGDQAKVDFDVSDSDQIHVLSGKYEVSVR